MRFQDPRYLQHDQYRNASNLDARIRLHDLFSTNPQGFHNWAFEEILAQVGPAIRLLEAGAGSARLWTDNAHRVPLGWSIVLSDLSRGMIGDARRNIAGSMQAGFLAADVQALPFANARFDAVLAHFMLYHVPDLPLALVEIARVLRPGGLLFAATLGRSHLAEIYEMARQFDGASEESWAMPSFRLENGGADLGQSFAAVSTLRYPDSLEIRDAGPLIDYILSMSRFSVRDPDKVRSLRAALEARIQEDGPIRVGKDVGMFVCRKRNG